MKNPKQVLLTIFSIFIVVGGLFYWLFYESELPQVVVYEFNSTPYNAGEGPREILPDEKLYKVYKYKFFCRGGSAAYGAPINVDDYLEQHPSDAVLFSFFGQYEGGELTIYSNALPDTNFFWFDGHVLSGALVQ